MTIFEIFILIICYLIFLGFTITSTDIFNSKSKIEAFLLTIICICTCMVAGPILLGVKLGLYQFKK